MDHETGHYHLHLHPISRNKGHRILAAYAYRHATHIPSTGPSAHSSALAAAAYRQARELGNGDEAFDYRRKVGVHWTGLFAPDHAPAWMRDPAKLWAAVDRTETRRNARLAQEVIIALPHQVGLPNHIALLERFARQHCVAKYGMIADVAIHAPPTHHGGDPRNIHAHIMLTDRPITPDGFAARKDRRYVDKDLVQEFREAWTTIHNDHMERQGLPYRIDHRTLAQQRDAALARGDIREAIKLDRLPQIHLGKAAHSTHPRASNYRDRVAQNRRILATNTERASRQHDELERLHVRALHATVKEDRRNAVRRANWKPPTPSYTDLQKRYGRPATGWGSVVARMMAPDIGRHAAKLASSRQWLPVTAESNGPAIMDFLTSEVPKRGPGNPWYAVTSRDLAFAFYQFGLITLQSLRDTLEGVWQFEINMFPKKTKHYAPVPPKPKPPEFPRPVRAITQKLEARLAPMSAVVDFHQSREAAFARRYVQRVWDRAAPRDRSPLRQTLPHAPDRGRYRSSGQTDLQIAAPHNASSDPPE